MKKWLKNKLYKFCENVFEEQYALKIRDLEEEFALKKEMLHLENNMDIFQKDIENQSRKQYANIYTDLGAVARQTMLAKWKIIDRLTQEEESGDDTLTCRICGNSHKRKEYETKISRCIFNGGYLERYICPDCGAIFGPTKFLAQGQAGIDEDYWVHYLGFSEGDSSYKEERAFFMLKPDKDKVYLNYGCGRWSKSLQNLREQGYEVYGYEPYAPDDNNPYLITSKEEIKKMRFDGIYSNDVLEHMLNPVEDLKFMTSLLAGRESLMSHSTACYEYKYEHTRFHTYFYTGEAIKKLTERASLQVEDCCKDEENDFICYVYKPLKSHSILEQMYRKTKDGVGVGDIDVVNKEDIVYGPYLTLRRGRYIVSIEFEDDASEAFVKITANKGSECFAAESIKGKTNIIEFELDETKTEIEVVLDGFSDNTKIVFVGIESI